MSACFAYGGGFDTPGATSVQRIVCASRHPPRHLKAGSFEALRLGGFEVLTLVSIDWLVGWLIVCLANVT